MRGRFERRGGVASGTGEVIRVEPSEEEVPVHGGQERLAGIRPHQARIGPVARATRARDRSTQRGLRLALASPNKRRQRSRVELPVCRAGGGTLPGVDLDDSAALLDVLEGRR